jgi:hypothetical protein
MDRGALALQVNEGKPKLVHLPDPPASENVAARSLDAVIDANGGAALDWKIDVSGSQASTWRARYHAEGTRKERIQEDLGRDFAGLEVSQIEVNDLDNVELTPQLHLKGKAPQFARKEGERWSIPAGPSEHMVHEYAELANRKLDVRIFSQATTVSDWTLHVPASMKVETLPDAHPLVTTPFGSVSVEVSSEGQVVHAKTTVTMTKTRISVAEYPAFRAWCESVDRALGQRLVVRGK